MQNNDNLSQISKISKLLISESRDQWQRYSRTFINTYLALARVLDDLPEIPSFS